MSIPWIQNNVTPIVNTPTLKERCFSECYDLMIIELKKDISLDARVMVFFICFAVLSYVSHYALRKLIKEYPGIDTTKWFKTLDILLIVILIMSVWFITINIKWSLGFSGFF